MKKSNIPALRFSEFRDCGEWEELLVGKICKSIVPGRNKPKIFNGIIPWVTTPEISGRYIPSNKQTNYISQSEATLCGAKLVPTGAVIIAAVGELGLTAIAKENVILNQQLHAFVCSNDIYNEYLAYFIGMQRSYMYTVASKTTIPYMNKNNCESIPILLPPRPEQEKIASCLSSLDASIDAQTKKFDLLKEYKKGLLQKLFPKDEQKIPEYRFPDFRGQGEWEEKTLGETGIFSKGSGLSKGDLSQCGKIKAIPYTRLYSLSTYFTSDSITTYTNMQTASIIDNPVLLFAGSSNMKENIGQSSLYLDTQLLAIGGDIIIYSSQKYRLMYLSYVLRTSHYRKQITSISQGATIIHLYVHQLKSLNISIPSLPEQKKIADCLSTLDKKIEAQAKKIQSLKEYKKGLMQQLFPS